MARLIKTAFFAHKKTSLFRTTLILTGALVVVSVLLGVLSNFAASGLAENDPEMLEALAYYGMTVSGKSLFLGEGGNTSLISLILTFCVLAMVSSDFNGGAIRNLISSGCKRRDIYFAYLISAEVYVILLMFVYHILLLILASLIFGYGVQFNVGEIGVIVEYFLYAFLLNSFSTAAILFFTVINGHSPKMVIRTVLFYLLFSLVLSILAGVMQAVLKGADGTAIAEIITNINPNNFSVVAVDPESAGLASALSGCISLVLYICAFVFGGAAIFSHKDLR